ncbi:MULTISPECIES: Mu transposase C-terminal domain-containing protein [Deefgea]|uniref:DDE-type integrase/transposase/recombinase n=1 Tax=Deefgea chitinilytica TaxID=570276 RepID=A0ABS2CAC0_9NEIS|nr:MULTISPECIES: Mu transposase C-terminal domain-containing protein [Deefgea]MBM5571093.1 DDE-type integrase/transposase/recombinase [Deefgea chitinilytica]MBM9888323.1 DDE-type integrase/transposase/recombinase [Deefgea sp. CFH1-16]
MLNKEQITNLLDNLSIPQAGRKLILQARISAPVRQVNSRGSNVITLLNSRKMDCEIRTESRHIEFAAAVSYEYDPSVVEYYAQPMELKLSLTETATGEIHNVRHFPDFLVIREDGITLEEWKTESKLAHLSAKQPYRYVKGSDGHWYSPQIEEQLAELGIAYRIYSEESLSRRRVENLQHLADYFDSAAEQCDERELKRLHAALLEHGDCTFHVLCNAPFGFKADFLNKAIADNLVVVDLDNESLTDIRRFRLFRDKTLRDFLTKPVRTVHMPGMDNFCLHIQVGLQFHYEGQLLTIDLVSEKNFVCSDWNGRTITLERDWLIEAHEHGRIEVLAPQTDASQNLSQYTEAQLQDALRRQAILETSGKPKHISERTLQRWHQRQHLAVLNGGNEVLALVPNTHARGNRTSRLTEEQLGIMAQVVETHWRNNKAITFTTCFRYLQTACAKEGIVAPSYPTMIAYIKANHTDEDIRTRHGKRMAYQQGKFVEVLQVDTPIHGSRPFQYVHIDHTQVDLEGVSGSDNQLLGRPWLTLAVDEWSRRVVGMYLSYDPPSYHSVMMLIRDMVRRHGRLPECIVTDNGRDFTADSFKSFLQVMGVNLRLRPAGQPRAGAVLERMFGRANTEYIHNLAGNTKATKNVRMTTGKHLPTNFAEWTLEALYFGLEYWAFQFYDQEVHPAHGCSPRQAFQRGLAENGHRPQRQVLFNQDFLIATCPPVDRTGERRLHQQTGIKVNNLYYWHPDFHNLQLAGQKFPVRYDPWDASSVYVRLKNKWVQAVCRSLIGLGQLTDVERKLLTAEYGKRNHKKLDDPNVEQRLREFMQVFTPKGALAKALEQQRENRALYGALQLGNINPVAVQQHRITREMSLTASSSAEMRSEKTSSSSALTESKALNNLPDFDTF